MRQTWVGAGRASSDLSAALFTLGCVLEDGEPADSERAVAQAGPLAAVGLHVAADATFAEMRTGSLPQFQDTGGLQGYAAVAQSFEPADARYLYNHRGHLMFVKPEERPFLTADLIRASSMTGTEGDIRDKVAALRDAGYTQFTVQLIQGQEDALADWARIKAAFT